MESDEFVGTDDLLDDALGKWAKARRTFDHLLDDGDDGGVVTDPRVVELFVGTTNMMEISESRGGSQWLEASSEGGGLVEAGGDPEVDLRSEGWVGPRALVCA